jgi:tetraacyldisaccharide 4'-kinase
VAGIASPASFFAALRASGWRLAGEVGFRDHHRYTAGDVAGIVSRARALGASRVVTTEKDLVRLLPFRPFPLPIDAVPLTLQIDDEPSLVAWLLSVIEAARR